MFRITATSTVDPVVVKFPFIPARRGSGSGGSGGSCSGGGNGDGTRHAVSRHAREARAAGRHAVLIPHTEIPTLQTTVNIDITATATSAASVAADDEEDDADDDDGNSKVPNTHLRRF